MTYLNQYHGESIERCLKKISQSKSLQLNCEEESKKAQEMHDFPVNWRLRRLYRRGNQIRATNSAGVIMLGDVG